MTRRERQLDELRALCAIGAIGAIGRAIDLAYEYFADFGPDGDISVLIAGAMEHPGVPDSIRRRFAELLASQR